MGLHSMVMRADTLAHFENELKIKSLTYPRGRSDKMIIRRCVLVFHQAGAFFLSILKFVLGETTHFFHRYNLSCIFFHAHSFAFHILLSLFSTIPVVSPHTNI
jgi:hypothetical protein